ncbi:MAG TPA: GHKL domain-containing protein, partial [Planctomycetaceae bacterium]|nr:GHKL domain-containing protein [Planctomycetaceae bacterium]
QNVFAGRSGGNLRSCDGIAILEDAIEINLPSIQRHGVEIERDYADVRLDLVTDPHKVLQIIVNLISNAVVATRSKPDGDRHIWIRALRREAEVVIEVEDDGEGIEEEDLVRIFQHGFTTRKDGHGFGLHSAAIAAQQLGGTLGVSSDGKGCGACFRLSLPAAVEEPTSCSV